jgi:hypothetical protein
MNIALTSDGRASIDLDALVGSFRSFGALGPVYEVIGLVPGTGAVRLRVLESGEELDYPVADLLDDPVAR